MNATLLDQIEENVMQLSQKEQLWLIERMIHRLRQKSEQENLDLDLQIEAMAADPHIQQELHDINVEFMITETDGLKAM